MLCTQPSPTIMPQMHSISPVSQPGHRSVYSIALLLFFVAMEAPKVVAHTVGEFHTLTQRQASTSSTATATLRNTCIYVCDCKKTAPSASYFHQSTKLSLSRRDASQRCLSLSFKQILENLVRTYTVPTITGLACSRGKGM